MLSWMVEDVSEPPEKWVQKMSPTADGAEKVARGTPWVFAQRAKG